MARRLARGKVPYQGPKRPNCFHPETITINHELALSVDGKDVFGRGAAMTVSKPRLEVDRREFGGDGGTAAASSSRFTF